MAVKTPLCTVLFATTLAGCTVPSGMNPLDYDRGMNTDVFGVREVAAVQHVITTDVPHSAAFVIMPSRMGTVVNVSETRAGNGVEQNIIYDAGTSGNGENRVRVRMVNNTEWPKEKAEPISLSSIKQRHLLRELRTQFPYASMNISNTLHNNSYGVFGYAVSSAKAGCFYGWQRMRANEPSRWGFLERKSEQPEIGLRVRYCRPGATEGELVDLMRNLRVDADPAAALRANKSRWTARPVQVRSNVIPPSEQEAGYTSSPPVFSEPAKAEPVVRQQPRRRTVRRTVVRKAVQEQSRTFVTDKAVPLPPGGIVRVTPVQPQLVTPRVLPRSVMPQSAVPQRSVALPVLPAPSNAKPAVDMPAIRSTMPPLPPRAAPQPASTGAVVDAVNVDGKRVIPLPG